MSKYIIEIKPEYEDKFKGVMLLGAENSNLYVDSNTVDELEELTSDYVNEHFGELQDQAYQKGLEDGKKAFDLLDAERDSEYQRGLDDAWECAKKLFSTMSDTEIEKVFPTEWENGFYGLMQMKPQYAIAKLKAYEEKQKADEDVKRGDVVRHKTNGLTYIVTLANECGYVLLDSDGNFATSCITNSFEKTGKHVDIDKILEGLRYDS